MGQVGTMALWKSVLAEHSFLGYVRASLDGDTVRFIIRRPTGTWGEEGSRFRYPVAGGVACMMRTVAALQAGIDAARERKARWDR
jgi:hypothetical protein